MTKKIGIVVPIYNTSKFLKECLESIINQTYTNFECVLVDDGSTDESFKLAKDYVLKDSRFVLIRQDNGGLSNSRNSGIKWLKYRCTLNTKDNAKQFNIVLNNKNVSVFLNNLWCAKENIDYIMFLDSDDFLELDTFKQCLSYIKDAEILWFDYQCFYDNCDKVEHKTSMECLQITKKEIITQLEWLKFIQKSKLGFFWSSVCTLIDFHFLQKIELEFLDGIIHEDHHFGILLFAQASKISILPSKFYHYRIRSGSIMNHDSLQLEISPLPKFIQDTYDAFERLEEAKYYHKVASWVKTSLELIRFVEKCQDKKISKMVKKYLLLKHCQWALCIFDFTIDPLNIKSNFDLSLIKKYSKRCW